MKAVEIHSRAMRIAQSLKTDYLALFEVLLDVERQQIYLSMEITSFRTYCVEMIQLSPHTANDFITVVRKSLEVPELAEAIRSKRTTIYKARKICSVLNEKNAKDWIALACECSTRIVEKAVAQARPREAVQESMKYVSGDVLEFKLAVSEEWEALLKQTKDLMSQKYRKAVSSEEALLELMQKFCEKEDPVRQAERAMKRKVSIRKSDFGVNESATTAVPAQSLSIMSAQPKPPPRKKMPIRRTRYRMARIEHEVNLRDQGQCSHIDKNGTRCQAKRWLEKHHIVEFANGGEHTPENLVTLCSAHHRIRHGTTHT